MIFDKIISFNYFSKLFIFLIFSFNLFEKFVGEKIQQNNNNNEMLENNLNVMELPVKLFPEPHCHHQVRFNSEKGPLINKRKISIGETIVHIWNCDYNINKKNNSTNYYTNLGKKDRIYCMMVRNCTVSNQNEKIKSTPTTNNNSGISVVEIIDEFGCSTWPDILPQIKYKGDLKATLILQAFALEYDKTAMNFSCQITLLLKNNGRCRRPQCLITRNED